MKSLLLPGYLPQLRPEFFGPTPENTHPACRLTENLGQEIDEICYINYISGMQRLNHRRKGVPMRRLVLILSGIILLSGSAAAPCASGETYGQLRALKRRAATVMRQKNDFVARVLQSYDIRHERTEEGVVTRLQIGSSWTDVNRIEIVPLVLEEEHGIRVMGHEIFFYTEGQILHLVSALTIR